MPVVYQLVYSSRAVNGAANAKDLEDILEEARSFNRDNDITGILLYGDGDFIQLLEGDEQTVRVLFERISKDSRHANTEFLIENEADERLFGIWSMAYAALGPDELKHCGGSLGATSTRELIYLLRDDTAVIGVFLNQVLKSLMADA